MNRPIKIVQFGGGVFLRGFFDWMLQQCNDSGIYDGDAVIVRSRTHGPDPLQESGYRYAQLLRGREHSEVTVVDSIASSIDAAAQYEDFLRLAEEPTLEVVVSNTTEAGLEYVPCEKPDGSAPASYPAKLTDFLYHRYRAGLPGLLLLPCELIEGNGGFLKEYVKRHVADWALEEGFLTYLDKECRFCNTLVDRIVSGAPAADDVLPETCAGLPVNTAEYFHLFVIEGEEDPRLPFRKAGLNVVWTEDIHRYYTLKVRLLNGAHSSMIPYALLSGLETVGDCMKDETMSAFLRGCLFGEILPSLDFDPDEARAYAEAVVARFENPYLHHACRAIALHAISKFRVRVLPSILAYREKFGRSPEHLLFALGKLIEFYREGEPNDDPEIIDAMRTGTVSELLANTALFGEDLSFLADEVMKQL